MIRNRIALFVALVGMALLGVSRATPIYSVRAANQCDGCHVEPTDWLDPPHDERDCTLDCGICHVSPTGGGLRTPSGEYYGLQVLPTWGTRPGADATGTQGRYRWGEGFSGWQSGSTPVDQIPDRYGSIDPEPQALWGADERIMGLRTLGEGGELFVFPMQAELYGMARLPHSSTLYTSTGLRSSKSDLDVSGNDAASKAASPADYFTVRELFAMWNGEHRRATVRAGRFSPIYGWRMPDHTLFTREALDMGVDRQVFGVEAGINPNYPYLNAALFAQGAPWWPGDSNPPGYGLTLNGGWRDLGWQLGGSLQVMGGDSRSLMLGPQYALNLYPVVLLGETDVRVRDGTTTLASMHEVNWLAVRSFSLRARHDWIDLSTEYADDHKNRFGLGAEWHPWSHVDLELWARRTWSGGGYSVRNDTPHLFELDLASFDPIGSEVFLLTHGWF